MITLGKASGELKLNGSAQSNGTTVVLVVVVEDVEDVEVVVVVAKAIISKHPSILQSGVIVVVVVVVGVAVVLVVVVVLVLEVLVVVVVGCEHLIALQRRSNTAAIYIFIHKLLLHLLMRNVILC